MKSSNSNRRAVTVGIFIFLGIAIFVVAILTLGGQQKTFSKAIGVRAIFDDVQGLQKGNNIWFSGVKIGTVKKISFYGNSQVEVDINIQESSQEYIRKDAMAKISSDGLIGNKIVVLYGGTEKSPPVENGDILQVEKAFTSDEMMNTLQDNNRNVLDITNDLKVVSKRLSNGEGSIGKLLTDESLMRDLQNVMVTLRRAAVNTERLTSSVTAYASQLNRKGSLANDLVTDTVLFSRLRSTAAQLDAVSATANDVVGDLQQTTNRINTGLSDRATPVGMLLNDQAAAADIRSTLQNLKTSTRKLDENMEALQNNFLLRGFFKKRNKERSQQEQELLRVIRDSLEVQVVKEPGA